MKPSYKAHIDILIFVILTRETFFFSGSGEGSRCSEVFVEMFTGSIPSRLLSAIVRLLAFSLLARCFRSSGTGYVLLGTAVC